MGAKPVFTHAALLGNDMTSRVFMKEATKRLKVISDTPIDNYDRILNLTCLLSISATSNDFG
jgi:hypothetical protein